MLDECLPMGCCSSRSATISPDSGPGQASNKTKSTMANDTKSRSNGYQPNGPGTTTTAMDNNNNNDKAKRIVDIGTSLDNQSDQSESSNRRKEFGENEVEEHEDFMTILMNGESDRDRTKADASGGGDEKTRRKLGSNKGTNEGEREETFDEMESSSYSPIESSSDRKEPGNDSPDQRNNSQGQNGGDKADGGDDQVVVTIPNDDKSLDDESNETSFEEELNVDLLRQYIAVDYEISQLEDRDALRLYHEKIEQLEQLERELDMISFEAEEIAVRSETDLSFRGDRIRNTSGLETEGQGNNMPGSGYKQRPKMDTESNSVMSSLSGSLSNKSSIVNRDELQPSSQQQTGATISNRSQLAMATTNLSRATTGTNKTPGFNNNTAKGSDTRQSSLTRQGQLDKGSQRFAVAKDSNLSYATIEEVFNRKIILEKERDKLKKEVEMVIIECDRLQQKYKRRDEILDKLFDGRTGNGLENHLEQQLNWLMEQKHYVDQVFYAWKRAETLTSQSCEQFASALELLKRLPKIQSEEQRKGLSENVCNLLIRSRQDMEQAQRYNPNVDAPFFTEAETERFDRIIETIQSGSISSSDYNQMATVVQFAYKRAVSIRMWLEQILQITIARDSFELAEEYKWIAIQLRKERIALINLKLQDPPYRVMSQTIRDQLASQHQRQQQLDHSRRLAITDGLTTTPTTATQNRQNEINRDSGIESDDIDIEEDIYRLLEMNKSHLEAAVAASREAGTLQATTLDAIGRPVKPLPPLVPSTMPASGLYHNNNDASAGLAQRTTGPNKLSQHDQIMLERVQRRVRGDQPLALSQPGSSIPLVVGDKFSGLHGKGLNESGPVKGNESPAGTRVSAGEQNDGGRGQTGAAESKAMQLATGDRNASNPNQDNRLPSNSESSSLTPSKLRIQLDEESRRSLLKQVDQIHSKHRNKLDNLRGSNKAKANDILLRLQSSKQQTKAGPEIV